jgi:hypothetical protein
VCVGVRVRKPPGGERERERESERAPTQLGCLQ